MTLKILGHNTKSKIALYSMYLQEIKGIKLRMHGWEWFRVIPNIIGLLALFTYYSSTMSLLVVLNNKSNYHYNENKSFSNKNKRNFTFKFKFLSLLISLPNHIIILGDIYIVSTDNVSDFCSSYYNIIHTNFEKRVQFRVSNRYIISF